MTNETSIKYPLKITDLIPTTRKLNYPTRGDTRGAELDSDFVIGERYLIFMFYLKPASKI